MWQQSDCSRVNATADNPSGCLNDLYPFVGVARNDGSGGNSMGFYNVSTGDAPVLKRLADEYTLNDNYHQPVMGGTMVQHTMIGTADEIPWDTFQGQAARRPRRASPIPIPHRARTSHSRSTRIGPTVLTYAQPGIPAIVNYLATLPWHPTPNCATGRYYGINNMSPGYPAERHHRFSQRSDRSKGATVELAHNRRRPQRKRHFLGVLWRRLQCSRSRCQRLDRSGR